MTHASICLLLHVLDHCSGIKAYRKLVGCLQFKRERANILQEKQAQNCGDCGGSGTQAALTHKLSAARQLQRVAATVCA